MRRYFFAHFFTIVACLLFLAISFSLLAQEGGTKDKDGTTQERGGKVRLRFIDNTTRDGYVVEADNIGVTFYDTATAISTKFKWDELAPESADELQTLYLGKKKDVETAEQKMSLPAVRITTKNGDQFEGVIDERHSDLTSIYIKNAEQDRFVKRNDISRQEKITLELTKIYKPEEIYELIKGRLQPADSEGYEKLAEELVRAGLDDRAQSAFKIALLLRRPEIPESKLYKDLLRLRDRLDDIAMKETIYHIQEQYLLANYDAALNDLDRVEDTAAKNDMDAVVSELRRIRSELNLLREISKDQQIISEWYRTLEAVLITKAMDRNVSYDGAVYYVKNQMAKEVEKVVAARFNMDVSDPSPRIIWERHPRTAEHKLSYDEASWLVEKSELNGKEEWWRDSANNLRYKYLKGIFVEQSMTVLKVVHKSCSTCGGEGVVDKTKYPASAGGRCPTCYGTKQFRVVIYR